MKVRLFPFQLTRGLRPGHLMCEMNVLPLHYDLSLREKIFEGKKYTTVLQTLSKKVKVLPSVDQTSVGEVPLSR